ncbi:MAG TPA: tRNA lysidine(34) synthetase TilS [Clostridia bacterium]|nr:tRNA lysidine(34) synthetase TilS [Clostridia bacterium]
MIEKILKTIKKYNLIENGDSIVVGVSGGPDSICLLHVLYCLRDELGIRIYAVHINHMLRGSEADMDQDYVRRFCSDKGIQLFERSVDVRAVSDAKGISLEEAGREARYQEFRTVAEITGSGKIAVAHNKNDQAETILMHIIRGTGLDGLKGMEYNRGGVIRPLLDISRSEIEYYCDQQGLSPRIDSSNLENIYTRNKIRLDLIPYIKKLLDIDISNSLIRMASLIKDDSIFIEGCVKEAYEGCVAEKDSNSIIMDISKLIGYDTSIMRRVIRNAIRELKGEIKGIENVHVENALELARFGRTGSEIHLPGGLRIEKSYSNLKLKIANNKKKPSKFNKRISIPGTTSIPENGFTVEAALINTADIQTELKLYRQDGFIQFFDYEALSEGIYIRNRENGDIFKPLKSKGKKKLKEYFIDSKIPRELRDSIPLVAIGNEIVWIIGYKISDKFKVTENTKCVLKLKYTSK